MPEVFKLPYEFVDYLLKPGLQCTAGSIPLAQYMCKTKSNGGNDNTHNLLKNLRWFKDRGNGPSLNSIVGGKRMDILLKGQGDPDAFIQTWNFMCRNKDQLDRFNVKVYKRRPKSGSDPELIRKGKIYDMYFKDRSDATALKMMVNDRFFGIDCIGFVANYLMYVGVWPHYKGYGAGKYDQVFKKNVTKAKDIEALNLLHWPGHVALVDWVWDCSDGTARVDICQSSSGGPQCNEYVQLKETKTKGSHGRPLFRITGGTPTPPVGGYVAIMKMDGLYY